MIEAKVPRAIDGRELNQALRGQFELAAGAMLADGLERVHAGEAVASFRRDVINRHAHEHAVLHQLDELHLAGAAGFAKWRCAVMRSGLGQDLEILFVQIERMDELDIFAEQVRVVEKLDRGASRSM